MAKCAYKSDGYRCNKKPVSGSKYCWRHTPTMIQNIKWVKALMAGAVAIITVFTSLYALGFITIPGTSPLRLNTDYSLYSSELDDELKVPPGNDPKELLNNTFIISRNTSSYLEKSNLETMFFAQREIIAPLGLVSKSPIEWLDFNPRMLLRIDDFQNINTNSDIIVVASATCGGGTTGWDFDIVVKEGDLVLGNVISSSKDARSLYKEYSYLLVPTLEPGEHERFVAHIFFPLPGSYKFSLGVEYWFNGEKVQQWTEELFSVEIPNSYQAYRIENVSCLDTELPKKPVFSIESCVFSHATYVCETTTEQ